LKKRREEPRPLPSFPFYPRCSSPVGGPQTSENPPIAHAASSDSANRIERRGDLRLSPEAGETPGAGQKVRTASAARARRTDFKNSVFPVYAGSRLPVGALGN
jgi:hypothetical protein